MKKQFMKVELRGDHEREKIGAMLKSCDVGLSPNVLIAQARRGFYEEGGADKIFLLLQPIRPETAKKIRKLIQNEFRPPSRKEPTTEPPQC